MLAQGKGQVIIASSRADELSFAGKPCSAFTQALLEAHCGDGASQQDGKVRVADLALYTGGKVPQRTADKQHPLLNYEQADNFVVAFHSGGEVQAKGLPTRLQNVEIEPEPGAFNAQINQQGQQVGGNVQNITGTVQGNAIAGNVGQIGDSHITRNVNTGGGTYAERDINVSGGDFVGRDKVNVSGGFYQPGWTVTGGVTQSMGDMTNYFAPLEAAVRNASPEAQSKVEELKAETAKGDSANDNKMAKLVMELGQLVPDAIESVVNLFAPAALGKIAGAATKFAVDFLRR